VTSDLVVDDAIGSATDLVERANLVSWKAAFEQATDDRQWVIEGMVRHGDNVAVAGAPGSGKSLFFLDVAARLAIGDQVVGFTARDPMNVLYLDHENNRDDITLRLQDMDYAPNNSTSSAMRLFPAWTRSTRSRVAATSTSSHMLWTPKCSSSIPLAALSTATRTPQTHGGTSTDTRSRH
jgi:AAA domain